MDPIDQQTIKDFGQQWTSYRDDSGFYGWSELFEDRWRAPSHSGDLRQARRRHRERLGRIVGMLLTLNAAHVVAVEPSEAFAVLKENTKDHADKVTYLGLTGDKLPASPPCRFRRHLLASSITS